MFISPLIKKLKSRLAFTLIELLVVISIIAILAGIALPVFSSVQIKGNQIKDLSNAKQIGIGIRLYSSDNDGLYPPTTQSSSAGGAAAKYSNDIFTNLVPQYIPQEKIFYLSKSAWTPQVPDENTAGSNALSSGENNFAYVSGMNDQSNPALPVVADGFAGTGNPAIGSAAYTSDSTLPGGVWKGKNAIVIRCDGSGAVETCDTTWHVIQKLGTASCDLFGTGTSSFPILTGTTYQIWNPH